MDVSKMSTNWYMDVITARTYNNDKWRFSLKHKNVREMTKEETSEYITKRAFNFGKNINCWSLVTSIKLHLSALVHF